MRSNYLRLNARVQCYQQKSPGIHSAREGSAVAIELTLAYALVKFAQTLPWALLVSLIIDDLKRTIPKGKWWMGRKLLVRLHLADYLLQKIYDLTDRPVYNAASNQLLARNSNPAVQ